MKKSSPAQRRAEKAAAERAELRAVVEEMLAKGNSSQAVDVLLSVVDSLHRDNERLVFRLATAVRARFGRSSERLTKEELGQLVLALGGTEAEAALPEPNVPASAAPIEKDAEEPTRKYRKRRPNHHGRTALSAQLPRVITEIPVPENERTCIRCGTEMQCIGHVDHETVEFVPAKIEVHVERRETRACKNEECKGDITTAPRQHTQAYERRAGMSLLAHLIEAKCDDALPIYRQQDQFSRLGFDVPLNTLYGYWDYATTLLTPVAEVILSTVLGESVVGVDDTRLDYLDPGDARGIRRGHLWCFVGESPLVAFGFTESWRAEDVAPWLSAIDGFIQCDDYSGYDSKLVDEDGDMRMLVPHERRLGCTMHVRRRFHKAYKGGHLGAAIPLKLFKDIYAIEAKAKASGFGVMQRLELRQAESLPLLRQFDEWVDTNSSRFLPTSPLGSAISYACHQRPFIRRCFTDGRFEIDNGRVEREIREPAIGRKNYLFSGSAEAAARLASAYTVVQSARHTGVHVRTYLVDILTKINNGWPARQIQDLLPHRWALTHGRPDTANQSAD